MQCPPEPAPSSRPGCGRPSGMRRHHDSSPRLPLYRRESGIERLFLTLVTDHHLEAAAIAFESYEGVVSQGLPQYRLEVALPGAHRAEPASSLPLDLLVGEHQLVERAENLVLELLPDLLRLHGYLVDPFEVDEEHRAVRRDDRVLVEPDILEI